MACEVDRRQDNSVFIPAKEIISLHSIILKSRDVDKAFGFDDTYYDLAKALRYPRTPGNNYKEFVKSREELYSFLDGKIEYKEETGKWFFRSGRQRYSIGITAEGIKKISIIDILLGNRYINNNSVIFFDEPEASLHPKAVANLLDIIFKLSECGIQFFLATHSYFVIKKLFIYAQQEKKSVPFLNLLHDGYATSDLLKEMPNNEIINESIRLYEQEVDL